MTIKKMSLTLITLVLLLSTLFFQFPPVSPLTIIITTFLSFLFGILSATYIRLFESIVQIVELHGIKVNDRLKEDFMSGCRIIILLAIIETVSSLIYILTQYRILSMIILSLPIPMIMIFFVMTAFIIALSNITKSLEKERGG